jgi:hypothetical protein
MNSTRHHLITVGQLRRRLEVLPEEAVLIFGCKALRFSDITRRGENLYQIEFSHLVCDDGDRNVYVDEVPPSKSKRM